MYWRDEWKPFLVGVGVFMACYYLPVGNLRFDRALLEAFSLVKWYAQEHVLLCLIPAFFIAGAIAVFVSQEGVMKYLGPNAPKYICYPVASVSGSVLAVCSCTVLPLFAGISARGAGLGPATAFLYSGPAINVLAIILTGRILGLELGIARAVGAVVFSVVIGLLMSLIFFKEEKQRASEAMPEFDAGPARPLWQTGIYFAIMIGILVFANWGKPDQTVGLWHGIYSWKWTITCLLAIIFGVVLASWFDMKWWKIFLGAIAVAVSALLFSGKPQIHFSVGVVAVSLVAMTTDGEPQDWFRETWGFTKQIAPLLFIGVLIAGLLLGKPGGEGLIPSEWITWALGGNSFQANLFASVAGSFMYFATLTEVPIVEGLLGSGMGKGPALALLLAGPALSLPNMLVIRSVIGTKKTIVFVALVCAMATVSGLIFGTWFG